MDDERYVRAAKQPRTSVYKIYHKFALRINKTVYQYTSKSGKEFISNDWDNLVILDACRNDWFCELNTIEGNLSTKISPGSESWEFMQSNFCGRELHDTVYVTANPHAEKIPEGTFHAQINLLESHWDSETKTVLPKNVIEETLRAHQKYPNKRIIAHFMQPHFPFIGPEGDRVEHKGIEQPLPEDKKTDAENPWTRLTYERGMNREQVLKAYRENHEIAIEAASELVNQLSGKSVITADHANLIGELTWPIPNRLYGHPRGVRKAELITVPWLECSFEERRKISADLPVRQDSLADETVEARLKDLGYV